MDAAMQFASRQDLRQSTLYRRVMDSYGWETIPIGPSQLFVRRLGPVSVAKLQRAATIDLPALRTLKRRLSCVQFIIEPSLQGTIIDREGKEHSYTAQDTRKLDTLLAAAGWKRRDDYFSHSATGVISLADGYQATLAQLPSKVRYNIKQSQQEGLTYTWQSCVQLRDDQKEAFYSLHERWSADRKIMGYSSNFLSKVMQSAGEQGVLLSCTYQGQVQGYLLLLTHDGVMQYFYTFGTDAVYKRYGQYGLIQLALQLAVTHGCSWFDFFSLYDPRYPTVNPRWKGFSEFKRRFHPSVVLYPPSYAAGLF